MNFRIISNILNIDINVLMVDSKYSNWHLCGDLITLKR